MIVCLALVYMVIFFWNMQFFYCLVYILSIYWVYMTKQRRPRGAVSKDKAESKAILVYFPKQLIPLIDQAVDLTDSDRSKFIRNSVRRHLDSLQIA